MGYLDQLNELRSIQETARKLYDWINEPKGGVPPPKIIEAIAPRLSEIRSELTAYLEAIEGRTVLNNVNFDEIRRVVAPDEPREIMALGREGLYIHTWPPNRAIRGIKHREPEKPFAPSAGGEISIAVYVDGGDEPQTQRLLQRVDDLVHTMGYEGPIEVGIERGSLFRQSKAKAQQFLASDELRSRLVKIERALELAGLEVRQAQVDQGEAEAVSRLLAEVKDIPRVCIRAGSVLMAKFTTNQGPVVLVRTLSQLEIRALERFPEIQRNPERVLEALATAVDSLETSPPELAGPQAGTSA